MLTDPGGLLVKDAQKTFGKTRALADVDLQVEKGEIMALLGPSGSGKSTLLYAIAGLDPLDGGQVYWDGQPLEGVPPHRRGFGLMFQDFALFPHMDVFNNVAFGLRMAHPANAEAATALEIKRRVEEMLTLVGLAGFEKRDVNTLSGGEQQRVALARSLAPRPRLLMLDEPLGSLDRNLRERLVLQLREILVAMHQTAIYVTHDQEEAFVLGHRVAVMQAGRVEQVGAPQELYHNPRTLFVAKFLGLGNLLPGQVRPGDGRKAVETPLGTFPANTQLPDGARATVLFRPGEMSLGQGHGPVEIEGSLKSSTFRGSICRLVVEARGYAITLDVPSNVDLPPQGGKVVLSFDPLQTLEVFQAEE